MQDEGQLNGFINVLELSKALAGTMGKSERYKDFDPEALQRQILLAAKYDLEYMLEKDVFNGTPYDDDYAFTHIRRRFKEDSVLVTDEFIDDYMQEFENFMALNDLLEWE